MSIFGFGKKKEEQKQPCCCGGSCTPEAMQAAEAEKKESGIKILGGGHSFLPFQILFWNKYLEKLHLFYPNNSL